MAKLSQEDFDRLLAWLDVDRDVAARKYETIRQQLIEFFVQREFEDVAEELADKTIDRVAAKLVDRAVYDLEPAEYFYTIARTVLVTEQRRRLDKAVADTTGGFIESGEEERRNVTPRTNEHRPIRHYRVYRSTDETSDFLKYYQSVVERLLDRSQVRSAKPRAKKPRLRSRVVNTGFSSLAQPDSPIDPKTSIKAATTYYFWFEIGKPQKGSIESTPTDIPEVPANARLAVVLFAFKNGLQVLPGADTAFVELTSSGAVRVIRQPQTQAIRGSRLLHRRLFFPVQTPPKAGVFRMRCNIYWGQTLLQSRLVQARVTTSPHPRPSKKAALSSVLDYKISRLLDPAHITKLNDHRLSVLLNKNQDGTHSFHFYGAKDQKPFKQEDVRFHEGELDGMLVQARGTLRLASWGDAGEWRQGLAYKYKDRKPDLNRLKNDLLNLAKWGYEFYTQVRDRLAGGEDAVVEFEQLLSQPGSIQFAMKESPRYVLPAALIYDQPLDTGADEYSLCPQFVNAFKQADSLEKLECLTGDCPTREDLTTVCPSGFWGFRHYVGLPLSVKDDIAPEISVNGDLKMAVGFATDLQLLKTHLATMQKLRSKLIWNDADNRNRVFEVLKDSPHVVYFYCHGGLVRNAPYLQVGPKEKPSRIQRSNLYAYKIVWDEPRPLVFINGCHTTAVAPTQALEFITPLVTYSKCAGVIGTEITIFEELATVFAEDCLGRFLRGDPIGVALRNARLKLLKEGNPLGLVYIPFVISGLTLVDKTPA